MIKFAHYWVAIICMMIAAYNVPDWQIAFYEMLLAITNMLFAIFWTIEEKNDRP